MCGGGSCKVSTVGRSELPPIHTMKRNLQCLSEHDRTAVSQPLFLSCLLFCFCRQDGTHTQTHTQTHTHTHTHTDTHRQTLHACVQLLFVLTER